VSRNLYLNGQSNRGRGEANIPGRLALLGGWDIPFGPGRPPGGDTALGKILGGWSAYSLITLQKGQWFTVFDGVDRLDVGSTATQRPQLQGNPNLDVGSRFPERWFNTDVFSLPPAFTYANAGRAIVEGPGLSNVDFSLLREFRLRKDVRLEFRFEAFNLTNHTNFLSSNNTWNFAHQSFGSIGSAGEARDLQFGFKIYY